MHSTVGEPRAPVDPIGRFVAGLVEVAKHDPAVSRALARVTNLLITPTDLTADRYVVRAVTKCLDEDPDLTPAFDSPDRSVFAAALS